MALSRRLKELKDEEAQAIREMTAIVEEAGDQDFTAEQTDTYAKLEAKLTSVTASRQRVEKLLAAERGLDLTIDDLNEDSDEAAMSRDGIGRVRDNWRDDPMCGYDRPRDFLLDVIEAGRNESADLSPQMRYLATAGSDEQGGYSDPVGGFFIPEGMSPTTMQLGPEIDPTAGRVTDVPMTTPTLKVNARVDKDHSSSVSGGLTVSRVPETQQPTSSRIKYEQVKLEASGQYGIAYATEQLLERSPVSFAAILAAGFQDEFAIAPLRERLRGTGAGEPLGVLNSGCLISVAKESMQAADTITGNNIVAMRKRVWRYSQAIWLANHDTLDQLITAHVTGTNADRFLFSFGNGSDIGDTLCGRPIFFTEYASKVGDQGDLICGVWSQYLWGRLGPANPRRAESIHVRFLNHERTFKFWVENDGQPWWRSALTPNQSSETLSPFVTLDERA